MGNSPLGLVDTDGEDYDVALRGGLSGIVSDADWPSLTQTLAQSGYSRSGDKSGYFSNREGVAMGVFKYISHEDARAQMLAVAVANTLHKQFYDARALGIAAYGGTAIGNLQGLLLGWVARLGARAGAGAEAYSISGLAVARLGGAGSTGTFLKIDIAKFESYALVPGQPKSEVFRSLGYEREDASVLAEIYLQQARIKYATGQYASRAANEFGKPITMDIQVPGKGVALGRTGNFKTGWLVEPSGNIRLVTPFSGNAAKVN